MIERWGGMVVRRAVVVLLVGLGITAAAMFAGVGLEDKLSSGGFDDASSESAQELTKERDAFGNRSIDAIAIFTSDDQVVSDPAFQAELEDTLAQVPAERVSSMATFYDTQDPAMVSHDEHATAVYISFDSPNQESYQNDYQDAYREIRPILEDSALDVDLAGPFAVYSDVNDHTKDDLMMAEIVSLPIVLLLSLIIFRSVTASLLPVLVGLVTVLGARAAIAGLNEITEVSIFAPNIITLIGLGLSIDYALFVVSRFREEIALTPDDTQHALVRTMATAGRTVMFSALTVAAAMSSLLVFPQAFLKSIGYGGIAAVLVAMVAALTVLPATLALLGKRVDSLRIPFLQRATAVDERARRLVAAGPRRDAPPDPGRRRRDRRPARRRLAVPRREVGQRRLPGAAGRRRCAPGRGAAQRRVRPGAVDGQHPARGCRRGRGVVVHRCPRGRAGRGRRTSGGRRRRHHAAAGRRGRATARARTARTWCATSATCPTPTATTALVGGLTADTVDLSSSVKSHLPWMGLIVVSVMLLLLFLAFGSLVLPLKAVAMNFFSITASFGVVTWIFSDGHLSDLLGFESSGFLDLTNPIVMLAVLFGLSMDYEVFLLSRVREQWDATGDNDLAVATGLQKTGRIITSAALLLAVVIGAFSLSGVVFMKMMGIGMLIALLVDATVVRALLVPATMKLLGKWNWWAPAPLARWWERYGFREEGGRPDAKSEEPLPVG